MPKTTNPLTQKRGVSINVVLTIVVVVVAVVVIGGVLFIGSKKQQTPAPGAQVAPTVMQRPNSHFLSQAPGSKVRLTEYFDFQCPACYQYYSMVTKQLEQQYHGRITYIARNLPLSPSPHPLAQLAAQAGEAAANQGKFDQMFHMMYDNYTQWAVAGQQVNSDQQHAQQVFDGFAQQLGLDMNKFHQDMNSPATLDQIKQDKADAASGGAQGTPTFFINGRRFEPNGQTAADIATAFHKELDQDLAK